MGRKLPSTFLELTNRVLRQFNEVELTSSNFGSASGFAASVKDNVNYAIEDINQQHYQWPFNHAVHTETLVAGTQLYALPATQKTVDWDTFYLLRTETPKTNGGYLPVVPYDQWVAGRRSNDDTPADGTSKPEFVFQTQGNEFGVSPKPDAAYQIQFEYWQVPTPLVAYDDTSTIPAEFERVIVTRAMWYTHQFNENIEQAAIFGDLFETQIDKMREILIPVPARAWVATRHSGSGRYEW